MDYKDFDEKSTHMSRAPLPEPRQETKGILYTNNLIQEFNLKF